MRTSNLSLGKSKKLPAMSVVVANLQMKLFNFGLFTSESSSAASRAGCGPW